MYSLEGLNYGMVCFMKGVHWSKWEQQERDNNEKNYMKLYYNVMAVIFSAFKCGFLLIITWHI